MREQIEKKISTKFKIDNSVAIQAIVSYLLDAPKFGNTGEYYTVLQVMDIYSRAHRKNHPESTITLKMLQFAYPDKVLLCRDKYSSKWGVQTRRDPCIKMQYPFPMCFISFGALIPRSNRYLELRKAYCLYRAGRWARSTRQELDGSMLVAMMNRTMADMRDSIIDEGKRIDLIENIENKFFRPTGEPVAVLEEAAQKYDSILRESERIALFMRKLSMGISLRRPTYLRPMDVENARGNT